MKKRYIFKWNRRHNRARRRLICSNNKLKQSTKNMIYKQYDNKHRSTPTILIELTTREWNRLKPNSIFLSESEVKHDVAKGHRYDKIYYTSVTYGSNMKSVLHPNNSNITSKSFSSISKKNGHNLKTDLLNPSRIKGNCICLVTTKSDIEKINTNYVLLNSSGICVQDNRNRKNMSGVVLLLLLSSLPSGASVSFQWSRDLLKDLQGCKPNIIQNRKGSNHFDSQGYIASFGNKGSYGMSSSISSVDQFANIKSTSKRMNQDEINKMASFFENKTAHELKTAICRFSKVFPQVGRLLCPIINVAYEHQQDKSIDINLKKVKTSDIGLWQSSICVNSITKTFHTEKDVTYTIITVPSHGSSKKLSPSSEKRRDSYFLFKINEETCFSIKMQDQISFFFNGTTLTHKQFCLDGYKNDQHYKNIEPFFNISSYGNEKLFRHLRLSLDRINKLS